MYDHLLLLSTTLGRVVVVAQSGELHEVRWCYARPRLTMYEG